MTRLSHIPLAPGFIRKIETHQRIIGRHKMDPSNRSRHAVKENHVLIIRYQGKNVPHWATEKVFVIVAKFTNGGVG